jgi:hypothetical protein
MSGFVTTVDASELLARTNALERKQIPFVLAQTLNDAGFAVRTAWRDEMPKVFQNPTAWTLNAVLVRRATKQDPSVEVFLRNELGDAIPPAYYLQFQVRGGARRAKRSEKLLRSAGVLGTSEFIVPAKGLQLDPYGNIPSGIITSVLSDVQALNDEADRSTVESRGRRSRRRDINKRGVYFANKQQRGKLPRGIYRRTRTGFGSSLDGVLMFVRQPQYQAIYNVFDIANRVFAHMFTRRWRDNLNFAVAGIRRASR